MEIEEIEPVAVKSTRKAKTTKAKKVAIEPVAI